ncbi:hypothetical protein [Serpentinicella alkaliphila]|uniref:Galactose mutarotase-like enzyme n=1 Tax=Serpentinicella alkaliphila TaxID=1734049 RepID=A0A4R2TVR3_9FIRM|nr:hypothetical protein [Serpentinicella alkaliphila]QUH26859.1 hypothetical protein HZR23_14760 [Serpentinicella alkaliphila]TCQ08088.1 galactose mutarotase-like enzyme [Serpentinicella alkaliphila]
MIYHLENQHIIAKINARGCELSYLFDKNGNRNYLYEGKSEGWSRQSPILFPVIGRLHNDSIIVEGEAYGMPVHGFAKDCFFKKVEESDSHVKMLLSHSSETLEVFPYKFDFFVTHSIENSTLRVLYKIVNKDDKTIYASVGGHPGFKLEQNTKLEDYSIVFNRRIDVITRRRYRDLLSLTKEIIELDVNRYKLKPDDFRNGPIIIEDLVSSAMLINEEINFKVILNFDGFEVLGLWTRESMVDDAEFICIEPWCGIDDLEGSLPCEFGDKPRIKRIEVGKALDLSYSITIG